MGKSGAEFRDKKNNNKQEKRNDKRKWLNTDSLRQQPLPKRKAA